MGDGVDYFHGLSDSGGGGGGGKDVTDAFKSTAKLEFWSASTRQTVAFKAFITNFSDAYTCNWESTVAQGRMDPIQSYSGTSRVISLGWDVVASSMAEAQANLVACETLVQMLYPSYGAFKGGQAGIKAPPYFKFKFLNLAARKGGGGNVSANGLFGTAAGLTYAPNWEVGTYGNAEKLFPKVVSLTMDFTVLHDHQLGEVKNGFPYGGTSGGTSGTSPMTGNDGLPGEPTAAAPKSVAAKKNAQKVDQDLSKEGMTAWANSPTKGA